MKLTGGDIMSNTINWCIHPIRLYALLELGKIKEKESDYYAGKLSPEEEAEMIAFLNRYSPEENE